MYWIFSPRRCRRLILPVAAMVLLSALRWATPAVPASVEAENGVAVPIIMYHSLMTSRQGDYVIDPALFEQDLQYIQAAGYQTVTVADLITYVDKGTPLPAKPILLTFDDGYYNNYLYAHPLLQQYGMRAVISPIAGVSEFYSDHPDQQSRPHFSNLTWEQLREMAESGVWEVQNHSYDLHHNEKNQRKGAAKRRGESDDTYTRMLTADLTAAQNLLTRHVGVTPTAFAYPFGAYSAASQPVLEQLGFRASLSCEEKVSRITRSPDSLWRLGRYRRPHGVGSKTFFDPIFRKAEE